MIVRRTYFKIYRVNGVLTFEVRQINSYGDMLKSYKQVLSPLEEASWAESKPCAAYILCKMEQRLLFGLGLRELPNV